MPVPTWRDALAWSALGAIIYVLAVWGASAYLHRDVTYMILRPSLVTAQLGLGLIVSVVAAGVTNRKRLFNLRNFRNFLIQNAAAIVALLLVIRGFSALAGARTVGATEWVAAVTGAILIVLAIFGGLTMASTHTDLALIDDEVAAEEMRERGRLYVYSFSWIAVCGLLLIGLALAGPLALLSPAVALAGALVLVAVLTGLGLATWSLSDELVRTLSNETGNMAFYLILGLGGGWAMLAHLGLAAAPAPLGWLILFILSMFVASFIVLGRRKLLTL